MMMPISSGICLIPIWKIHRRRHRGGIIFQPFPSPLGNNHSSIIHGINCWHAYSQIFKQRTRPTSSCISSYCMWRLILSCLPLKMHLEGSLQHMGCQPTFNKIYLKSSTGIPIYTMDNSSFKQSILQKWAKNETMLHQFSCKIRKLSSLQLQQFRLCALKLIKLMYFYTPVWKTGRIMPWQCPSVRLSVRPSVRPRFPDFSSTCFEISIWNLVYTFSRWHDMSSLSCITIGSLWPSLQPKVGQTYFLQSWPHKSR